MFYSEQYNKTCNCLDLLDNGDNCACLFYLMLLETKHIHKSCLIPFIAPAQPPTNKQELCDNVSFS